MQKMTGGDVPFYVKIWRILTYPLQNANFPSIFARSASAVTAGETVNNNINNNPICKASECQKTSVALVQLTLLRSGALQ